ncbi:beta-ketoacyl-ACP synthase II [Polyangium jinanense]|uniref:3-oxoacyl-[acyl-carrier-protein] synthase 2 n=1 Tax=Polyangium jinanense TaxID=2829994 RepID=A0A9X3X797_9BACT|nr:beta-ketoacyl-ACP synthase II [Polyangium jinanense]MDC3957349.1 beta-ketoacyl-ACP synthase II [Polyangium jinanense]MDC3982751.1 beta-ketoacyl-ACP synthase II [Polyangium jinanense]
MPRRVVVTGMGVVSPVGVDVSTFWESLLAGRSGVSYIREFPTDKLRSDIAASVSDFDVSRYMSPKEAEVYGRVTHFSLGAAVEAVTMAGLDKESAAARSRVGCLMSTGMGSVDIFEEQIARSNERGPRAVSPYFVPGVMPNGAAALISMRYGFMGPSYSLASACATGTHSIATSALLIEAGEADVMIAGGAEAATRMNTVAGFGNARALSKAFEGDPTRASRPFDKRRQGFVMGEGAGVLVLEEEEHAKRRGAKPLAVVGGFGMTTDAEHLTRPHPEGLGLALALERALQRAGIGPEAIDYINPHATSTPQGDMAEILAFRRVFGERLAQIPISATKSMIGHLLGGAGAAETIAVVCSLRDQVLHPSINVDELDPELGPLDVVRDRRPAPVGWAAKCSAGFGGHNCALVLGKA